MRVDNSGVLLQDFSLLRKISSEDQDLRWSDCEAEWEDDLTLPEGWFGMRVDNSGVLL